MERISGSLNIWCPGVILLALIALFLFIFRRKPKMEDEITEEETAKEEIPEDEAPTEYS